MIKFGFTTCKTFAKRIIPEAWRLRLHIVASVIRQNLVLWRIRKKVSNGGQVNVLFLVSEVSKWKCQSLYELLSSDRLYNPIVGLTCQDVERNLQDMANALAGVERAEKFFSSRGVRTIRLYDAKTRESAGVEKVKPDIVFYQQPWNIDGQFSPGVLSKMALPCYVPYFVPNYSYDELTYGQGFHRFLRYYFVLNDEAARRGKKLHHFLDFAGTLPVVGHPMLDDFYLNPLEPPMKSCVIYAPHFTFSHPNNPVAVHYSTFLDTGEYLLQYAKAHPEMSWVFKPHPVLKTALLVSKAWSREKVAAYYSEWGRVGRVCEDGDYLDLFRKATAMITDCGSFLSEFGSTKKPIIHLINHENNLDMPELYATYYRVHNLDELSKTLHEVLEKGNDYKKDVRVKAVEKANLSGQYAAKNIMDFFAKEFRIKD